MVKIYDDYGDEPEDKFIPLPDLLACSYYDLEMDSYEEDALFFNSLLPTNATILELGCGSGRVGRHLVKKPEYYRGGHISSHASKSKRTQDFQNAFFSNGYDSSRL